MNKYYTTLLLFIGALTTPIAAADATEETSEETTQNTFFKKHKKEIKLAGIGSGVIAAGFIVIFGGKALWKKFKGDGKNENKKKSLLNDSDMSESNL